MITTTTTIILSFIASIFLNAITVFCSKMILFFGVKMRLPSIHSFIVSIFLLKLFNFIIIIIIWLKEKIVHKMNIIFFVIEYLSSPSTTTTLGLLFLGDGMFFLKEKAFFLWFFENFICRILIMDTGGNYYGCNSHFFVWVEIESNQIKSNDGRLSNRKWEEGHFNWSTFFSCYHLINQSINRSDWLIDSRIPFL